MSVIFFEYVNGHCLSCSSKSFPLRSKALTVFLPSFQKEGVNINAGARSCSFLFSFDQSFILIFVTNYGEYAAEGYEVNAFRFLPKLQLKVKLPDYFSKALAACQSKNRTINVFCEGESTSVFLDQLVYAETDGRAAILHISDTPPKTLKVRMPLRSMEDKLCDEGFLRIHNSYLVNMNYLSSLQTSGATLTTGETLPLSLHNYRAIKSKYLEWKGRT